MNGTLANTFKTLDDLPADLSGKVALVRVDLNLPMSGGSVTDTTRIDASRPTILELAEKGAKVLLLAHFGRPGGERNSTMSVSMTLDAVEDVLGREVMFIPEVQGPVVEQSVGILRNGDIGLLENTRFWKGEAANDADFAKGIAAAGDFYVNDAFSAAHRAHASTEGLAHLLPSYAGRAMAAELAALDSALGNPEAPGCRRGGRGKGFVQAGRAGKPGRAGAAPHHRRRHGEHLPRRTRRVGREEPVRT